MATRKPANLGPELSDTPVRRTVPASGTAAPATSAPRSAFDQVRPPSKPAAASDDFDPSAVVIEEGVPLPSPSPGRRVDHYQALLDRMKVGDRVKLSKKQALGLQGQFKKKGLKAAVRDLGGGVFGVWRLS